MHNFKAVVFASLVGGSLIPSAGFAADRDLFDDLKDQFKRGRDQVERDRSERDGDRYDRDRRGDRRDRYDREDRVSGTVSHVDRKRQRFSIKEKDNDIVTVLVPPDIDSRDKERFSNLREGENVRLAGRFERENTFKLEEFR